MSAQPAGLVRLPFGHKGDVTDTVSKEVRSAIMAAVRDRDTKPELLARRTLHRAGFRFRLHRRDLPGSPDIVLPRHKTVVFVHGCFWHGHHCRRGRRPTTRPDFWNAKLDGNIQRDAKNQAELQILGWTVFVIWTCETEAGIQRVLDYLRFRDSAPVNPAALRELDK